MSGSKDLRRCGWNASHAAVTNKTMPTVGVHQRSDSRIAPHAIQASAAGCRDGNSDSGER